MKSIGFIGCGNMGSAIAEAVAAKYPETTINLYDSDSTRKISLSEKISAKSAENTTDLVSMSDIVVLAVKPQILPDIYAQLKSAGSNQKYISIAAGVSLVTLKKQLGSSQIIRFMPNIAASVSKAVTAVAAAQEVDIAFKKSAERIASSCGTCFELDEALFPAFIGISGSAIAFFYQFLHAVALGGTREGIPYPTSLSIAADTFSGAIELMKANAELPSSLITKVTSAGGTTIDGIHALESGNLNSTVMNAVNAAAAKAQRLEQK